MSIGERIADLRKEQNISQAELARLMEVSRQAVSKWETDQSSPDTLNLIKLADLLDSDVEYLASGRRTYGRRPPVVIKTTETVEKIVEKPVVQVVEKIVEKTVDVPVIQYVDRPVIKKVYRVKHQRNPLEYLILGAATFIAGLILGLLL